MSPKPDRDPVDRLEGVTPAIVALREQIRRLAAFDAVGAPMVPTLLLQGETGTGKGLVARLVHDAGPRAGGPFVPVNCAAIPETMLEAELFGHEPGAFTDARRAKPGLFEAAGGGTLFLDEIDSLTLALQSKLLTAIESKRVRRLGAVAEQAVDVKLLAATQRDLGELAAAGEFRPDLHHRLAVVVLALPPLRERGDDVVGLARALLGRFAAGYGAQPKRLTADAEGWLRRQPWPGNVRELGHLMERVTLLHPEATVDARGLARLAAPAAGGRSAPGPEPPRPSPSPDPGEAAPGAGRDPGAEIRSALARTGGNVVRAAHLLGISRDTIRYRMRRHGIGRPDLDAPPVPPAAPPVPAAAGAPAPAGPPPEAPVPAPAWEQKPVAVVAVGFAWPEAAEAEARGHEPWTEHERWDRLVTEKLAGLGGTPVQEGPGLAVWAFGIPEALDQLVERAVHGALAVRHLATETPAPEHAPEVCAAVHYGAMLVDGAAPSRGALALGETVVLPLRLLGEAEPGEIVASPEIERRIAAWARIERFEPRARALGGRREGFCRVLGLRPWRERSASPRRLTPFVGRERELLVLDGLVGAAAAGAGQLVGIVGPPGSGKSRLLRELRLRLEPRGVMYAEAHGLAHASLTPFLPLVELMRTYLDVTDADSVEAVGDKVRARLAALGIEPDAEAPYLLALLGVASPARIDGETVKRRSFDLFRRIALAVSRQVPLVLAVENAHWIDATTEACLAGLADHLAGARCVLVVTYRPGYRPGWLDRSYATQLALAPLGPEESRRIVAAVAGSRELSPAVAEQVLARADGNPLFLEELGRALVDEGPGAEMRIPDTVHAVIAARIDRLAAADRRLLRTAAVVGRDVPLAVLERVADLDEEALRAGLGRLQEAEFLFERTARGEPAYGFKHALTQAAAYQGLSAPSRQALHLRVMEVLESAGGERRPEMLQALAEHAAAGADWGKAVACFREAGTRALARDAYREAGHCLEAALAALARLPQSPETLAQGCDIRFALAETLYRQGELARVMETARQALAHAEALDDRPRLAFALGMLTHWFTNEARYAEALDAGERALAIAAPLGLEMVQVWTWITLGRTCLAQGRYPRAIEYLRAAIDAIGADGDRRLALRGVVPPSPQARAYLALGLARTGDLDEAVRQGEEALRGAEAMGGPVDQGWACYALGRALHARTDWGRAVPMLERALALCDRESFAAYTPRLLSALGSALAQAGRGAEGLPLLERALAAARAMRFEYGQTLIVSQLGTACVDAGRVDEAAGHAALALTTARQRGERGEEAWALLLTGDVAARRAPPDLEGARAWYGQALALGEELGMRPLAVRCRLALGDLERRAGRGEDARRHLSAAAEAAAAMGIGAWLARARAGLA